MGCRGYGYFILGYFVAGHIIRCTDKMLADKILGDKTPVKIARGQNAGHLLDREGKMPILLKHFIYDTDGQVKKKASVKTCSRKYLSIKAL